MSRSLYVTAAVLVLSNAAFAQQTPVIPGEAAQPAQEAAAAAAPSQPAGYKNVKDQDRMVAAWSLKVKDAKDRDVYGEDGKKLGEVEAVLEDTNGDIRAIVLEYGGFLGFGAKRAIVPLDQLQPAKVKRFTTGLTEEQLAALPAWTK